ncbi:hypothetical protein BVC80_9093g60 [Macleaya cordata]|uniref:Uncharacterized protein n=1 Tax=Macleaya cordata TaxID=56857 RepID=A0A200PWX8_MACCD|nr:hypothetical protein BVC80_9093g60 [Macleaya cordata]
MRGGAGGGGGGGAGRLRFWWCIFFAFAIISSSSARNIVSLSAGNYYEMVVQGRSLKAMTDDYDGPTANKGHDPRNRGGSASGGGNRKA